MIFVTMVTLGQGIFAISIKLQSFYLAILGRIVFGYYSNFIILFSLGGVSLKVVAYSLEAFWFKGKEIALAMSIDTCLCSIAIFLNNALLPKFFAISGGLSLGMTAGFLVCFLSMMGGIATYFIDRHREKKDIRANIVYINVQYN